MTLGRKVPEQRHGRTLKMVPLLSVQARSLIRESGDGRLSTVVEQMVQVWVLTPRQTAAQLTNCVG